MGVRLKGLVESLSQEEFESQFPSLFTCLGTTIVHYMKLQDEKSLFGQEK